jgi:hypothetical protein
LKNVKQLKKEFLRVNEEVDQEYILGARPPDLEEWDKILRSLFCFPIRRRTYLSFIHSIDHYQRAYKRRIDLLQKGFRILIDSQIDLRFRTSWSILCDLHIDVHGRHILANNLYPGHARRES